MIWAQTQYIFFLRRITMKFRRIAWKWEMRGEKGVTHKNLKLRFQNYLTFYFYKTKLLLWSFIFLPKKFTGILVFSRHLKILVLSLGVQWSLRQNLKDEHWKWLRNQNCLVNITVFKCEDTLLALCHWQDLCITTADRPCSEECMRKIYEIHRRQETSKEHKNFQM